MSVSSDSAEVFYSFPFEDHKFISKFVEEHFQQNDNIRHFSFAWNGVFQRFHGAAELASMLEQSLASSNSTRSNESRNLEDQTIFYLYSSALSAIECAYFSAAVICNFITEKPDFSSEAQIKNISPKNVSKIYKDNFPDMELGDLLGRLVDKDCPESAPYLRIHWLRNVLSHRGQLGRVIFLGNGNYDGDTALITNPNLPHQPVAQIALDQKFVGELRENLSIVVTQILAALRAFLEGQNSS